MPEATRRVAVTGASGLIGRALTRAFEAQRVDVVRIGRSSESTIRWDIDAGTIDLSALEGVDAVVNLAGATIARRWTVARQREIAESRMRATTLIATAVTRLRHPPRMLLSGSAVGFYGDRGDELLTEDASRGTGFLADVAAAWEAATQPAEAAGIPVSHLRTGIVIARSGGALQKMLIPFRLGLGGRVGSGRQWMSWIGLHDAVRAVVFAVERSIAGPVNLVGPEPVTNMEFTGVLGAALRRPTLLPVPAFAIRATFGAMGRETLLASQRATPSRLLAAGFRFDDPDIASALRRELAGTVE